MLVIINQKSKTIDINGESFPPDLFWGNVQNTYGEMVMEYNQDDAVFEVYVVTQQRTTWAQIHNPDTQSKWYQKLLFETVMKNQTPQQYQQFNDCCNASL